MEDSEELWMGIINHRAVVDESDVLSIRSLSKCGVSGANLSRIYNISSSCAYDIINMDAWVHV